MFCAILCISIEEMVKKDDRLEYPQLYKIGLFVEAMLDVLRISLEKLPQYSNFFTDCTEYYSKRKHDMPDNEAFALFGSFKAILDH